MRRLYQKIYFTIIASLLVVVAVSSAFWRIGFDQTPAGQAFEMAGELAAAALPPPDAPQALQSEAVARLAQRLDINLALYRADGTLIAHAGDSLPPPPRERRGWFRFRNGPVWSTRLPDGRAIVAQRPVRRGHPALGFLLMLGAIALAVALCAYPVVRGLTRRLERLQAAVETVGEGNLSARVVIKGRDEVARLAASFNRSAARIEELVNAHRLLLANASHELRTPLSRIQLAVELFQETGDPKYKTELQRNIAELDQLVDEILLASRLDATPALPAREAVDLLALTAEECARYDIAPRGKPVTVMGDPRLLRRLIRNLLENAKRHGKPPVQVELHRVGGNAVVDIMDAGEGIPESESERVFMPFHRLRAHSDGTGLGLALVRQIARLHGGDAVIATRPEASVCFRITLPHARSDV